MVTPGCSFQTSWRSGMLGACVVRPWPHVVVPVFREHLCLGRCVPRCCFHFVFDSAGSAGVMFGPTLYSAVGVSHFTAFKSSLLPLLLEFLLLWLLFEFIAYLTGLNSNPSGSSDPWVAARPSGSLVGVREVGLLQWYQSSGVASFPAGSECELQKSVAATAGRACCERGCWFARAAVEFILGLRILFYLLRSGLCSFWATIVLPLWFEECRLVELNSGEDGSWCFWWRFSTELPWLFWMSLLSLCGDELSLLPVGLSAFSLPGRCQSRCGAFDRVSGRGAGQVVFLFGFEFLGYAGGTSCVPVVWWFASLLTPCVLSQMVALSVVRQVLAVTCVRFFPLAWKRVHSVGIPCFGLGPFEVDVLSSTSAVVSFPVRVVDVLGCLTFPTSDVFSSFASARMPVEHVV
ncbi:hypothetical protein Taro_010352 [Colocasia esculenta]|uniref:Transmembrane protein n=1 Tax=Colocasia esculenta TaxID=4460 RepID=A0A843U2T5_COLES|nr:hypothetical protein [Colocasia esculenta]